MQPILIIAMLSGGPVAKTLSDKLQKLQNRAPRVMIFSSYDVNSDHFFDQKAGQTYKHSN